jgi:hypothetical protein
MKLSDIYRQLDSLKISDRRYLKEDYLELVFLKEDFEKWNNLLAEFLGPIANPFDADPSKDHWEITKKFGGVRKGQALYQKDFGDYIIIAMLWPWQNETHITLKMPLIKK